MDEKSPKRMHPYMRNTLLALAVIIAFYGALGVHKDRSTFEFMLGDIWAVRAFAIGFVILVFVRVATIPGFYFPWTPKREEAPEEKPLTLGGIVWIFMYGILGGLLVMGIPAIWYMAEEEGYDWIDLVLIGTVLVLVAALLGLMVWLRRR